MVRYYGLGIEVAMFLLAICHHWVSCEAVELSRFFVVYLLMELSLSSFLVQSSFVVG